MDAVESDNGATLMILSDTKDSSAHPSVLDTNEAFRPFFLRLCVFDIRSCARSACQHALCTAFCLEEVVTGCRLCARTLRYAADEAGLVTAAREVLNTVHPSPQYGLVVCGVLGGVCLALPCLASPTACSHRSRRMLQIGSLLRKDQASPT